MEKQQFDIEVRKIIVISVEAKSYEEAQKLAKQMLDHGDYAHSFSRAEPQFINLNDDTPKGSQESVVVVSVSGGVLQYATSNTRDLQLILHDEDDMRASGLSSEDRSLILDSVANCCVAIPIQNSVEVYESLQQPLTQSPTS